MTAQTPAQRQAAHKARRLSDGLVHWKRWVHPDDVPHLVALADKLARKRAKLWTAPREIIVGGTRYRVRFLGDGRCEVVFVGPSP